MINKRGICSIMALVGVLVITFVQVYIIIDDDKERDKQLFLEENLINQAKKCVIAKKCEEGNISIQTLKDNDYLEDKYLLLLSDYSFDSYVSYPNLEVNLRKKETAVNFWN